VNLTLGTPNLHLLIYRSLADQFRSRRRDCQGSRHPLDRYFRAFEERAMPKSACAPRIEELSGKLRADHHQVQCSE
jgi:hypothetical protein